MAKYEITVSAVLLGVTRDLCNGSDLAATILRDMADAQLKYEGVKEFGTDQALKAFPGIWGAICRSAAAKLGAVTLPAED